MNRQKILIVDDSEMNREMLKAILGEGYKYAEAVDGAQALRMLQQDMNIDLVLLDINMPKMDGFAVLEHMNQFRWIDEIPVIMISAADDRESIKRCYSLGVADYIRRPFDSYIVQRRVQNTLRLYANQKRLMGMVSDQIYRNQRDSNVMIGILSHIVEFRNSESAQHVLQVQTVTGMLLRRLVEKTDVYHLTEEKIRLIVTASALHDIGKISIPENILNKPGRLTPEEFDVIRTHPAIGASMLEGLTPYRKEPLLKTAIEICRWHHERWDGRGYPDGLLGEQIPISAQVVALADVYDALTSDRCYKKAYSHDTAITMILNGECGAFNPMLLDCLQEISANLRHALPRLAVERSMKKRAQRLSTELLQNSNMPRSDRAHLEGMEGVALIDVNSFKHINDTCGHAAGDAALRDIAGAIRSCIRKTDILIRYGGDEFLLLFPRMTEEIFLEKKKQIQQAVRGVRMSEFADIQLSVSVGGVCGVHPITEAIRKADYLMYLDKAEQQP